MKRPLAALLLAASLLGACDPAMPQASSSGSVTDVSASPGSASPGSSGSASAGPSGGIASPSTGPSGPPVTSPPSTSAPPAAATPTPTPAPPLGEFPQSWSGTWADPATVGSGSLELTLTGKEADFGGSITMDGTACLSGGILTGSYDGREIEFTVGQRGVEMRFEGTAAAATMTGTFESACDNMNGTWTVTRTAR